MDKLKFCETVANIKEMVLGLSRNIALRTESVQKWGKIGFELEYVQTDSWAHYFQTTVNTNL